MCQSKPISTGCGIDFETVCAHNPYVARKTHRKVYDWLLENKTALASLGTPQKIYNHIHNKWGKGNKEGVNGIGRLTKYDLTMIICKEFGISLNGRVYLMGRGPRRAAVLLWIWSSGWGKKKKCNETGEFYIMVDDVRKAFQKSKYLYDKNIVDNGSTDDLESYMCNWQKHIKWSQAL